jgi:F-type H+-transporting ATPase subunit a
VDFDVRNFGAVNIFGQELWITESLVNAWIVMGVLIIFAVIVRIKLGSFTQGPPSGFQNVIEMMVERFDSFVQGSAGPKLAYLGNWFFAIFLFALLSNLSGLFPLMRPPTADWSVTFAMAFATFVLIQVLSVKYTKGRYLLSLLNPLNIVGELARPVSLSFRLFGNILSGMILLTLLYGIAPPFVHFVIPAFLHAYFDVAMGLLQAFIFTVLSLSFIGTSVGSTEG